MGLLGLLYQKVSISSDPQIRLWLHSPLHVKGKKFFRPADVFWVLLICGLSPSKAPGKTERKQQISLVDQALQAEEGQKPKKGREAWNLYSPRPVSALERGLYNFKRVLIFLLLFH